MLNVFLSHAVLDESMARLFKTEVEATRKATVYLAVDDVEPGAALVEEITKAIGNSDAFVVLVTRQSQYRPWVNQEIGIAKGKSKLIFPLVEAGVDVSEYGVLAGIKYVSVDPADPSGAVASLSALISKRSLAKDLQELGAILVLVGVLIFLGGQTD